MKPNQPFPLHLLFSSNQILSHRSKSGSKIVARNGKSRIREWMSTVQRFHHLRQGAFHRGPTLGACCTPTGSHTPSRGLVLTPPTSITLQPTTITLTVAWDTLTRDCGNDQGPKILGSRKKTRIVVDYPISKDFSVFCEVMLNTVVCSRLYISILSKIRVVIAASPINDESVPK